MSLIYKEQIIAGRAAQIITGSELPDDSIGNDGDIYIKFKETE